MGMTIDNSIAILVDYLEWQKLNKMDGTGIDEATRNLIGVARKFQKIEEIYKNEYKNYKIGDRGFSKEVRKVLEDGNDD